MKIRSFRHDSAVTNQAHVDADIQRRNQSLKQIERIRDNMFDGQRHFPNRGSYGGSTQSPATKATGELKHADELVESAQKDALKSSRRGAKLINSITQAMSKFKLGASLMKLLRKIPGLSRFLGGGLAVVGYIAGSSTAHAMTIPRWVNELFGLKVKFKKSTNPLVKLECLRKMCYIRYRAHRPIDEKFAAALFGARVVYQQEPAKRARLMSALIPIFLGYREAAGDIGYALQNLCTAAKPVLKLAHSMYGCNPTITSMIFDYQKYFETFERASKGYVKVTTDMVPSSAYVISELSVEASPATAQL